MNFLIQNRENSDVYIKIGFRYDDICAINIYYAADFRNFFSELVYYNTDRSFRKWWAASTKHGRLTQGRNLSFGKKTLVGSFSL